MKDFRDLPLRYKTVALMYFERLFLKITNAAVVSSGDLNLTAALVKHLNYNFNFGC